MSSSHDTNSDVRRIIPNKLAVATVGALAAAAFAVPCPADVPVALYISANFATPASGQVAASRAGVLQDLGDAAVAALGPAGIDRLARFMKLPPGWDGPVSKPIELDSVTVFSNFFESTGIRPKGLAVFMSPTGNVVTNWLDTDGMLVELEFQSTGIINYFFERSEEEGVVLRDHSSFAEKKLRAFFERA